MQSERERKRPPPIIWLFFVRLACRGKKGGADANGKKNDDSPSLAPADPHNGGAAAAALPAPYPRIQVSELQFTRISNQIIKNPSCKRFYLSVKKVDLLTIFPFLARSSALLLQALRQVSNQNRYAIIAY